MPPTLYEGPAPTGKPGPTGLPKANPKRKKDEVQSSPMLVFGGLCLIAALGGYLYLRSQQGPEFSGSAPKVTDSIKQYLRLPDAVREKLGMKPVDPKGKKGAKKNQAGAKGDPNAEVSTGPAPLEEEPFDPYRHTTLLLANGERIFGDLVDETPQQVVLKWEYGQATFKSSEIIQRIAPLSLAAENSSQTRGKIQPGDSVALTLHNGEKLSGELVQELPDEWVIRFDFGEVNFKKAEITHIAVITN